jgi:DMSO/TMAO reductase YedYZ molybdopterin-dependent catalytic subunit
METIPMKSIPLAAVSAAPASSSLAAMRRRHLLAGSAGALAAAGLGSWSGAASAQARPLPDYAAWKDAGSLIVHTPTTIETRRGAFGSSGITPAEQLYVRNNLPTPPASVLDNRNAWELTIEGLKPGPRTLTLGQLKNMGLESVATVLQCSGNGRGFFPSKPSGTPWTVGAAGCVVWSGVPVRAVAEALGGTAEGAAFLTGTGGEKLPEGVDPKSVVVERSVPIKALGDALLAWEMNGAPIPLAHGGPLRLVVPGYQGVNNIKYVKRLAFTAVESDAKIMSHGYRITPPGAKPDPAQASVLEMNVKSWINSPHPESGPLAAGPVVVQGVAFGGGSPIKRVEVSVDGGKTWRDAKFIGPDLGRFAWRQFVLQARLPAGEHLLLSRATDQAGQVQPEQRLENTHGYNNNSWADHGVKVVVA